MPASAYVFDFFSPLKYSIDSRVLSLFIVYDSAPDEKYVFAVFKSALLRWGSLFEKKNKKRSKNGKNTKIPKMYRISQKNVEP